MGNAQKILPLLGIALFAAIVWLAGPGRIIEAALSADPVLLLLAAFMLAPISVIQAYKWHYLIRKQKLAGTGFVHALRWYFMGIFYGAITPAKLGSFIRISLLQKATGRPLGACSSSVVLDRILDTVSLLALTFAGSLVFLDRLSVSASLIFALLLAGLVFALWALTSRGTGNALLAALYRMLMPGKLKPQTAGLFREFRSGMPRRGALAFAFILSLASWALVLTQTYVVALALGMEFDYLLFLPAVAVAGIISLLPVTINGLGTREAALIVLLSGAAYPVQGIVAMSLLSVLLLTYLSAAIGALFAFSAKSSGPLRR